MNIALYIAAGLFFLIGLGVPITESPKWYAASGAFIVAGNTVG